MKQILMALASSLVLAACTTTGSTAPAMLAKVSADVNQAHEYRTDMEAYGKRNYYASPAEFSRKGGDCDDFAGFKMWTLKQAGIPEDSMRLAYVVSRKHKTPHMVLVVSDSGTEWVLDNNRDEVVTMARAALTYDFRQTFTPAELAAQWRTAASI